MAIIRTTGRTGFGTFERDEVYGYNPSFGEGNEDDYLFGFPADMLAFYNLQGSDIYSLAVEQLIARYEETTTPIDDGGDLLAGGEGDDFLFGGGGDDFLTGGPDSFPNLDGFSGFSTGNDVLFGGWGNDRLAGGNAVNVPARDGSPGRDILIGGPGDDLLFGSRGDDTAWYRGPMGDYTIVYQEDGTVRISANASTPFANEGADTLTDMEFARFSDVTIPLFAPAKLTITADSDALSGREGDGQSFRTYTVARDGDLARPLTVDWALALGGPPLGTTKGAGVDDVFGPESGVVAFRSGEATASITVGVQGDPKPEFNEYYEIRLTQRDSSNPIAAPVASTYSILNDDWPTVTITPVEGDLLTVFEGAMPAKIKVTLSASAEFPVGIVPELSPGELASQLTLTPITVPAGRTSIEVALATGLKDSLLESIQSGTIAFTATGGTDPASGAPKVLDLTEPALNVQIKDELLSPDATDDLRKGLEFADKVAAYIANTTEIGYKIEVDKGIPLSAKAQLYVDSLNAAATTFEIGVEATLITFKLAKELEVADAVARTDQRGGAEIAYQAYTDAKVTFTSNLIKGALVGSSSAFVGGVVAGLTGVAVTAALPFTVTVVVGIGLAYAYDEVVDSYTKAAVKSYVEAAEPREQFIEGYLDGRKPLVIRVLDGYIEGAETFVDTDGDGTRDADESQGITDATGRVDLLGPAGMVIATGGRDVLSGLPLGIALSAPAGSTVVSPLTSVLVAMQAAGVPDASATLLSGLGLLDGLDLTRLDVVAAAAAGDVVGIAAFLRGAQVYNAAFGIAQLFGDDASETRAVGAAVVRAIADVIGSGGVDLASVDTLRTLLDAASVASGKAEPGGAAAVLEAIAGANGTLWALRDGGGGDELLDAVGEIQAVLLADPEPDGPVAGPGQRLVAGTAANETHQGSADQDLFLFDLAEGGGGDDVVRGFGADDLFVTTQALFDANGDRVITFGSNRRLDLDPASGAASFFDEAGRRIQRLEFDGSVTHEGVTYFVYSRAGSSAGLDDLGFG